MRIAHKMRKLFNQKSAFDIVNYDLRTGEDGERPEILENVRNVSLPESDPLFGEKGPLTQRWSR